MGQISVDAAVGYGAKIFSVYIILAVFLSLVLIVSTIFIESQLVAFQVTAGIGVLGFILTSIGVQYKIIHDAVLDALNKAD